MLFMPVNVKITFIFFSKNSLKHQTRQVEIILVMGNYLIFTSMNVFHFTFLVISILKDSLNRGRKLDIK